ncbi:hypothetical protein RDWZM_005387 [Blomia tropicalis]|uniref:Uncharacterized protein n=1 Tax=Blomia tropicalis TaxID=40697 RepID=A0A9Q0M9C0_BLOTA|nr:hypothetical protein RDWZM_005387 [Blomia tropicalis]
MSKPQGKYNHSDGQKSRTTSSKNGVKSKTKKSRATNNSANTTPINNVNNDDSGSETSLFSVVTNGPPKEHSTNKINQSAPKLEISIIAPIRSKCSAMNTMPDVVNNVNNVQHEPESMNKCEQQMIVRNSSASDWCRREESEPFLPTINSGQLATIAEVVTTPTNERSNVEADNKIRSLDARKIATGGVNKFDATFAKQTQAETTEAKSRGNDRRATRNRRSKNNINELLVPGPGILNRAQDADRTLTGYIVQKGTIPRLTKLKEQESILVNASKNPNMSERNRQMLIVLQDPFNQLSVITDNLGLTGAGGLIAERFAAFPRPIRCIINATYEAPLLKLDKVESYRIPVEDTKKEDLSIYFDEVTAKIHEIEMKNCATVVHCFAGVSRSATLVIAYLIRYKKMSLEKAFRHTKSARSVINPNIGFLEQLSRYEAKIHGESNISPWQECTQNGITKRLPVFIIADYLDEYHIEFELFMKQTNLLRKWMTRTSATM